MIGLLYPIQHQSYGPENRPLAWASPWTQGLGQNHQSYNKVREFQTHDSESP